MTIRGEFRPDGSFVGYDYDKQVWIDTHPGTERDPHYPPGSANNPQPYIEEPTNQHV